MYSKLLCSKCSNLSTYCTRLPPISSISRILLFNNHNLYDQKISFSQISSQRNNEYVLKSLKNEFKSPLFQSFMRTAIKGGPGYTKFGHGRQRINVSKYAYFWYAFLFGIFTFAIFFNPESYMWSGSEPIDKVKDTYNLYSRDQVPKAKELKSSEKEENSLNANEDKEIADDHGKNKKSQITFRNRKIIEYENRIRQYSTPDKIFRYFATIQVYNDKLNEFEVFMTPNDFLRSITFGAMQPQGLGLDSYNKYDPKMLKLNVHLSDDSIFKCLSPKGLISFSDYVFLVTMLTTPPRHFEIAFYMFDIDGNGNIDVGEFEQLQAIIRNQTSFGQRHRDTRMTGSVIKGNSTLNEYFFGHDMTELLTVNKFIDFQKKFQKECIQREFEAREPRTRKSDGLKVISDLTFCEMILAYAGFSESKRKEMLKRVTKIYSDDSKGITLKEYNDFFEVLRSIQDIDTALKFYSIAGASIDKGILKHVSKTVANVDLSNHVINIIFHLFDEDGDGKLSRREFINVLKKKLSNGLKNPKDTGFIKLLESASSCFSETFF